MRIAICIKQVPDPTEGEVDKETGTVVRSGKDKMLNPYDKYAIETGLRIKENLNGEIFTLSMGPESAREVLRYSLSMGVDNGILLNDKEFAASDTWATSFILSRAIKKIGDIDLVICGREAIDGETAQVGPELAEHLNFSHVTNVREINKATAKKIKLERLIEDGYAKMEINLPALFTVVKGIYKPRVPSLKNTIQAKKTKIRNWDADDLNINSNNAGLKGSPTQLFATFAPESNDDCTFLKGSYKEQSNKLINELQAKGAL